MTTRRAESRRLLHSAGFTIVELLVVIGIISVIAALLLPVLFTARTKSQQSVCISNLRQIGHAIALYAQDYDELLPYAPDEATQMIDPAARSLPTIKVVLRPYGATDQLFRCPSDHVRINDLGQPTWFAWCGSSYKYNDFDGLHSTPLAAYPRPSSAFLAGDLECFHGAPSEVACGFFDVAFVDFHVKPLTAAGRQDALNNMVHQSWPD